MSVILKVYKNFLMKYPISSQAIQTGILMGTGDLIAQVFVERKQLNDINLIRTGQFTFVGTFFVGPPLRIWYGTMEKFFGSSGKVTALKKVALDQIFFAPFFLATIMAVLYTVQGFSLNKTIGRIKQDYPDVLLNNYKLWPAVQMCNFYVVPLQYQVITVQIVAIFWNTYLSWKMNKNTNPKSAT